MNKLKNEAGVSLLELLIYIAVFAGIVLLLASILPVVVRTRATANARFETQENLRLAVEKVQQAVLDKNYLETSGSCPLDSLRIGGDNLATTTFQISGGILQMREGDANPFVDLTSSEVSVSNDDGSSCLFTKISNLPPAKSAVQTKIKVSYNDQGRTELKFSDSAQITISLR